MVFMRKFTFPKVIILTYKGNKYLKTVNYFNLIVNAKLLTPVISRSWTLPFERNSINSGS